MIRIPVIAIFDFGKTSKKIFLFDEQYNTVYKKSASLSETTDEDGFPCENLENLRSFIFESLAELAGSGRFVVKAVNFSAYGASLVYVDRTGRHLTPLYSYVKPYPANLSRRFYADYGGKEAFSLQTASPVLGSLNSGLQLYRLKYEQPEIFRKLYQALHLPQYLSFLLTGRYYSDMTSIGCHTGLWDFNQKKYHSWLDEEGLTAYLAPIENAENAYLSQHADGRYMIGIGLHDSSASLIPYMVNCTAPFVLISTGTWCVSLNPFNQTPLTHKELENDSLCYMQYDGSPVKASRLHSGLEYERQVKRIAEHFHQNAIKYQSVKFHLTEIESIARSSSRQALLNSGGNFFTGALSAFKTDIEAYYHLMMHLVRLQFISTRQVIDGLGVKKIFVDGGFSENTVFMNLLAIAFPENEVYAAATARATALGAAFVLHKQWNQRSMPEDIIKLKYYPLCQGAHEAIGDYYRNS